MRISLHTLLMIPERISSSSLALRNHNKNQKPGEEGERQDIPPHGRLPSKLWFYEDCFTTVKTAVDRSEMICRQSLLSTLRFALTVSFPDLRTIGLGYSLVAFIPIANYENIKGHKMPRSSWELTLLENHRSRAQSISLCQTFWGISKLYRSLNRENKPHWIAKTYWRNVIGFNAS